jgi:hypothetical protein
LHYVLQTAKSKCTVYVLSASPYSPFDISPATALQQAPVLLESARPVEFPRARICGFCAYLDFAAPSRAATRNRGTNQFPADSLATVSTQDRQFIDESRWMLVHKRLSRRHVNETHYGAIKLRNKQVVIPATEQLATSGHEPALVHLGWIIHRVKQLGDQRLKQRNVNVGGLSDDWSAYHGSSPDE